MRTRWPHPPPKGVKCDANVPAPKDWNKPETIGLEINIWRCQKPAVETLIWGGFETGFETWLCQECADSFVKRKVAMRNPKKRKR